MWCGACGWHPSSICCLSVSKKLNKSPRWKLCCTSDVNYVHHKASPLINQEILTTFLQGTTHRPTIVLKKFKTQKLAGYILLKRLMWVFSELALLVCGIKIRVCIRYPPPHVICSEHLYYFVARLITSGHQHRHIWSEWQGLYERYGLLHGPTKATHTRWRGTWCNND